MLYRILRLIGFLLFKILFRIRVEGRDNLPRKGGCIIASNHLSYLDPIVIGVACFRKLNFLAREDLFKVKFLGWLITKLNALPLDRGKISKQVFIKAIQKLKQGNIFVIFPEGTRSQTGEVLPGYPGVSFFSYKAEVPIVPCLIIGTDKVWGVNSKIIKPYSVSVIFGKQLTVKDRNYNNFSSRIMEEIVRLKSN